ncbi:UDP-N-acetylglucosamine 1-carboxyvinyltransferase [Acidiferrimicrobium sp. IK]|uniref:UDP-N-acetylglucosamine 1-carboxyvinyltransferase n=1 Tax=Acidiferrimicrobium sp. IK TaxID=2871700 RepID=UPI0021CB6946|nr:UDP-N-acetylglucosamine 1-carboxyvinyltransferase [Acidiferrimicrobium sp. IK]MCU4185423.1 UDP-N-acetylglucosamine 1-carboxyvinyltransferase [Acidiferrimicrobium sp. IK]
MSDAWLIEPSGPLRGEVEVHGSKNAVTKHMVAAILGAGPSTIANVPDVGDVEITTRILEAIGATVSRDGDTLTVAPPDEVTPSVPLSFSGLNRIPVLLLGPLLHLAGEAWVPRVGGDRIGSRPVDFHVESLRAFGAEVTVTDEGIHAQCAQLRGAIIELPYPSVGATESALLTGALAQGKTVIRNAATEPEVLELAFFLQRMGARIELAPERRIVIEGVPGLRGATTRLQGDRNEAFSYLVAGLLTGGRVRVIGCGQDRLVTAITTLLRMGATVEVDDQGMTASAPDGLRAAAVQTDVHPGFMTDWQTPLMVLFTQAEGMSVLHETVYEDRFVYVPALQAMGGEIELFSSCLGGPACRFHDTSNLHSAVVRGVSKLRGAEVDIPDVRAGFSSVIAAAAAQGRSTLRGVHHLERGYHRPAEQLRSLGMDLTTS